MKKKTLRLTKEQKARGVVFSSVLIGSDMPRHVHEVTQKEMDEDRKEATAKIERLKDASFFNAPDSPYKYNLIRQ